MPPKAKAPAAGAKGDKALQSKSPAQFFADNKNIAGFDNPGKSLYTTVREFVENSLDSAETIGELPNVELSIEEIDKAAYDKTMGLDQLERKDESIYRDVLEAQKQQEKIDKEAKKAQAKNAKEGAGGATQKAVTGTKPKDRTGIFRVTCKDNGQGMHHKDVPNMLGRVLSGTKYGVKQTRGKFGLGAKMALLWSKMSTGLPVTVRTARQKQDFISVYTLDIDIHKNEPNIHKEEKLPNPDKWHGAELSVTIEGNWSTYGFQVLKYLRQLAVITPYANFQFKFTGVDESKSKAVTFRRRTDWMPAPPAETKHHPSSVNIELLKTLRDTTKTSNLLQFLNKEFTSIGREYASRLIGELGEELEPDTSIKEVSDKQVVRIHQLLRAAHFDPPDGDCLSPAGEYNLRLGIMKELRPTMVATCNAGVAIHEGNPFVVEAGVSLGGKSVPTGLTVFRYANRIPLLFEGGNDVATRTAGKLKWDAYKIDPNRDRVGIFVSIVSTKIPFKGTSKEYIGEDATTMAESVQQALRLCALQLKTKLVRAQAAKDRKERKKVLYRYIPDVARAVFGVLQETAAKGKSTRSMLKGDDSHAPAKRRRQVSSLESDNEDADMAGLSDEEDGVLERVSNGLVKEETLANKLTTFIDQLDGDQALDLAMKMSTTKEDVFLSARKAQLGQELHTPTCVMTLIA
mmetsp:Transcript_21443/g.47025  ORF Transcript_21443/g.47025 Transcript_21443/m.47025 type:complete len:686 (-) Transcript_21443:69-2126(-)|eukprot:CAMPEP_0118947944 /NCGR_PEP_ID=MMETSP1169-20130426/46939_1 /TAXON_ID=36882 /ORGANISM="Pyramimonas obovata, Strain CCMP722" /LENGTH=685 /DNA_ID=CAMNT_0006894259 /DNA_START=137 /DNA_END=2194 /DNA_ORIENTATION=-